MEIVKTILGIVSVVLGLSIAVKGQPLGFIAAILTAVIWFLDFKDGRKKDRKIAQLDGSVVHLKTQTNPRSLSNSEGGDIVAALQGFGPQKIDMTYMAFNVEADNFCNQLASAFSQAGLDVHKHAPIVRDTLPTDRLSIVPKRSGGILISYAESRKGLAEAIFDILAEQKISIGPVRLMDGTDEDDFEYGSESLLVEVSQKDA